MIKYCFITDEEKGLVQLGVGCPDEYYIEIGMEQRDVEQSEIDFQWYLIEKCPHYTEEEKEQIRKDDFYSSFFNTSLGWIRRSVTMADGSSKDFLSDLLPAISMALNMGQAVNIITYTLPDFTQDITDWTIYQEIKQVTPQFIQECFNQLNNDFIGG